MAKRNKVAREEYDPEWVFHGQIYEFMEYQGAEAVCSGPAGTGKSVAAITKLHMLCQYVPRVRCLMVRKTRESLTESGLVTYESKVLPPGHKALKSGGQRRMRQVYHYPNGSDLVVGGMDKPSKIMSTEFDVIFVQESIELKEEDWEALISRLRNGKLPFQQIIADTNPDAPTHWLKRRCDEGKCKMFESRHEDNPYLYDRGSGRWTPEGEKYIQKLDALSGPRLQRLRHGRWAQAEGVVYSEWNSQKHIVDPQALEGWERAGSEGYHLWYPPPDWERLWAVDFGYTNPFVLGIYAKDHDGRLYLYREIYHTGRLVEDHAKRVIDLWRDEAQYWARRRKLPVDAVRKQIGPRAIVCDHDAEGRATLERHLGLATTPARKFVKRGIQMVSERLRPAGDGRPRLFVARGCLDQRDEALAEAKKPCCLVEEIDQYVWNSPKDEPVKEFDHHCDALRYLVAQADSGMSALWESPESIPPSDPPRSRAIDPEPRLRYGCVEGRESRRGARLFGGGA